MTESKSKANQWRVQQQQYKEDFGKLDRQLKHLTHESEQRELKLTIKLDQKVAELKRVMGTAFERQQEFVAMQDQMRQERDYLKMERDTWKVEFNKVLTIHEEKKEKHQVEIENIKEEMDLWKAKCSTFDDHVRQMESEALKKERECELAVSNNCQLNDQLQEITRQFNMERQEKGQLSAKLTAFDHQYRLERETWLTDKSNMDRAISDMTVQMQELQLSQRQTHIMRDQLERDAARLSEESLTLRQQLRRDDIANYHPVSPLNA